jgi:hypothetical protein
MMHASEHEFSVVFNLVSASSGTMQMTLFKYGYVYILPGQRLHDSKGLHIKLSGIHPKREFPLINDILYVWNICIWYIEGYERTHQSRNDSACSFAILEDRQWIPTTISGQ